MDLAGLRAYLRNFLHIFMTSERRLVCDDADWAQAGRASTHQRKVKFVRLGTPETIIRL